MLEEQPLRTALRARERKLLDSLNSPARIQDFLDRIPYRAGEDYICPLEVLQRREAHCFDGAIFGAAALRLLGYPPRVLYLTADKDDHHMLAVFRRNFHWGAVSKSNFSTLGLREPVYRTLRELVMSYFDFYHNVHGYKSLRSYVGPLTLSQFDHLHWTTSDQAMNIISDRLDDLLERRLLTRSQIRQLELAGSRVCKAGLMGANKAGLYRP